jgi:hypothetical protein
MLLEDIVLAVAVGVVLLMVGVPIVRYLKVAPWRKRDPLAEAQERLKAAMREAEAARVNREADKIYEGLYDGVLSDDRAQKGVRVEDTQPRDAARAEPPHDDGRAQQPADETTEKGKRHGQ